MARAISALQFRVPHRRYLNPDALFNIPRARTPVGAGWPNRPMLSSRDRAEMDRRETEQEARSR